MHLFKNFNFLNPVILIIRRISDLTTKNSRRRIWLSNKSILVTNSIENNFLLPFYIAYTWTYAPAQYILFPILLEEDDKFDEVLLKGRLVSAFFSIAGLCLLAYLMYGEVISFISYIGGTLVIIGVIIGTIDKSLDDSPKQIILGVLYGLIANLCTAYSVLLLRPIMEIHPVVPIALIRFSTGIIISAVGILFLKGQIVLKDTVLKGFTNYNLLAGAFFGTFLSVIFWLAGFKYTLAGRAAIYNQLSTIFIILLASIFLNEIRFFLAFFYFFLAMVLWR